MIPKFIPNNVRNTRPPRVLIDADAMRVDRTKPAHDNDNIDTY